jgi:hypothetical protein
MISLNLLESNWCDNYLEIDVLKSVNKLYFGQNNKKWANLVFLFTFLKIFLLRNLGKF